MAKENPLRGLTRTQLALGQAKPATINFWLTVAITAVACLGIVLVVGTRHDAIAFRVGIVADREIRLKCPINILNETATNNERERQGLLSPLIFRHDPQPIEDLSRRLYQLAREIAKAKQHSNLPESIQLDWRGKVTPKIFANLKQVLPDEKSLREFADKLDRALDRLNLHGTLDKGSIPPEMERDSTEFEIYTTATQASTRVKQSEVLITDLTRPDGQLTQDLSSHWKPAQANALLELIASRLTPTLTFDSERTRKLEQEYRSQVQAIVDTFKEGYLVVPRGEKVNEEHLRLLRAEHRELLSRWSWVDRLRRLVGYGLIVLALIVCIGFYIKEYQEPIATDPLRLAKLAIACLITLFVTRIAADSEFRLELLPISVVCLFLAILFDRPFALILAFGLSVLSALQMPESMDHFIIMLGGIATGISLLDSIRARTKLIYVGAMMGLTFGGLSLAMDMLHEHPLPIILQDSLWSAAWGITTGFIVGGCLPFFESIFDVATDISLLELADTSHILLQELVRKAPGTYNHSATVSIIAEAAANKIGCNSLIVRVGALFHDIGKMQKPDYFVENRGHLAPNRHQQLEPALSALIIIGHVKDGAELGRRHRLPERIIDMIEQHHGTTRVDYFFHEANREAQQSDDETVDESAFRYPGPKPQSKEAAVLMLADCVEGATRAMTDPTPASIEKLVHRLARQRLLDQQFSEANITLEELSLIEESLIKSLTSVYHGRIAYPIAAG